MQIKKAPVKDLVSPEWNPRQITTEELEKLKTSLEEFGYIEPIIVNDVNNHVVGGNQRLKALIALGYDEVDCVYVHIEDINKEKACNVALNKISGDWDEDKLRTVLEDIELSPIDIKLTGFDELELTELEVKEPITVHEDDFIIEDEEDMEVNVQEGDLFRLGEHYLLCGDSTNEANVKKLMQGAKADMVFTDPPYGMNLDTDYSKMGNTTTTYKKVIGDDKEFDMKPIFKNIQSPVWYVWGGDYLYKSIPNFDDGVYIVWSKRMSDEENKVFGSAYELCWTYPKRKKEIWFVRGMQQSSERLGVHPTQKPIELCVRALNQNKNANSVIDLFGGTGSTLIACEQLNKKCYMMELDPYYCQVIINRWEEYTGKKATKIN